MVNGVGVGSPVWGALGRVADTGGVPPVGGEGKAVNKGLGPTGAPFRSIALTGLAWEHGMLGSGDGSAVVWQVTDRTAVAVVVELASGRIGKPRLRLDSFSFLPSEVEMGCRRSD